MAGLGCLHYGTTNNMRARIPQHILILTNSIGHHYARALAGAPSCESAPPPAADRLLRVVLAAEVTRRLAGRGAAFCFFFAPVAVLLFLLTAGPLLLPFSFNRVVEPPSLEAWCQ